MTLIKCRACMAKVEKSSCRSINLFGLDNLTYKAMFEISVGYKIEPTEPQHFCELCVYILVSWYEFKTKCKRSQDLLLLNSVPVKEESEEACHSETIWYDDGKKFEPELFDEIEPTVKTFEEGEIIRLTFQCYIKYYCTEMIKFCGTAVFEGANQEEIMHQIWLFVKPYLKREIIFYKNGREPKWHEDESPQEKDIHHFIQFQEVTTMKIISNPSFIKFQSWINEQPYLLIYPYSSNLKQQVHWNIAEKVLINRDMTINPVSDFEIISNDDFRGLRITFVPKIREYKVTGPYKSIDNIKTLIITGNNLSEFLHNMWLFAKSHIVREILFAENDTPYWNPKGLPSEDVMSRFVEIKDTLRKKVICINQLTLKIVKSFQQRSLTLVIYPYSMNIDTVVRWKACIAFINPPDDELKSKELVVKQSEEDVRLSVIKGIQEKLKEKHDTRFLNVPQESWRMWAHYIGCFNPNEHDRLINEAPPTQMLPFFDGNVDLNLNNKVDNNEIPPKYHFSVLAILKQAKHQRKSVILGRFRFCGDTPDEIRHSIWIKVRGFLVREIVNMNNELKWSSKETPTEEDLVNFVSICYKKVRSSFTVNALNCRMLERWIEKEDLCMNIYQFSNAVNTVPDLRGVLNSLCDHNSATWHITKGLIKRLEDVNKEKISSFDNNWRIWAHYIQGFETSLHENLIKQNPPRELAHLFSSASNQYMLQELWEQQKPVEEQEKPPSVYQLLGLDKNDVIDEKQLKQCPFPGCTSVLKVSGFFTHFKHCRYNPNIKMIYHCPFEGCNKSYAQKYRLRNHKPSCRYNPNRESRPARQCPYCPAQPVSLSHHIFSYHSGNKFICDMCGVEKRNKGCLKLHILKVHKQVKIKCDKCPMEFKSNRSINDHIRREHTDKPFNDFICEHCSYQTYSRANIIRHFKIHHDPNHKKFICPECNKSFPAQYPLNTHMKIHVDRAEFACNVCSHVCKTEIGLKSHMTLHQEWKYECPVCFIKRRSSYEVRMHCKRKHPEYKLPPKGTVMKTTSRFMGKQMTYFVEEEERKSN